MTDHIPQATLDAFWNFASPTESEGHFREALDGVLPNSSVAYELTTQLARALGLQERYAEADALLDSVPPIDGVVVARTLLERGRLRNSSGHPDAAIPLFEEALAAAAAEGNDFLVIDAAHMLGIADRARAAHWTASALASVEATTDVRAKRWAVSLHNNLGWTLVETGQLAEALAEFELAADAARDYGTHEQRQWAQEAIDETLDSIRKQSSRRNSKLAD